jgi:lauroyl/myristoyl acyltransferase
VSFLGKEATTIRTVAGMLQRFDCSIVPIYALMNRDGSYTVIVEKARDLGLNPAQEDQFIAQYQQEHNDIVSRWIKTHPDHWFGWFHKRYKGRIQY